MISASTLLVRRGGRAILDVPDLIIGPGQVFAILGPNGAGKSTLLRVLAGETRPDRGEARLGGQPVLTWGATALARRRAVLPQSGRLAFPLTAREVVALGRLPHAGGASRGEDASAVTDALAAAGVSHLAGRSFETLSGGEQQRVQLARVLAQLAGTAPAEAVLFLDEPTSALDLPNQHAILRVARERAREGGLVVLVLHDLALAAEYADRALLMAEGRRVAEGAVRDVLTPELAGRAFGMRLRRVADPEGGRMLLVPA